MSAALPSHPDRLAATLAQLDDARRQRPTGPYAAPDPGSADCRIELKLLAFRAARAMRASAAARDHLAALPPADHPDLWAGTIRDGVARGFRARLEEAISLAPLQADPVALAAQADARSVSGRELRKRRDLVVVSGGAQVAFTRKAGLTFTDRRSERAAANFLWFEARRDLGTLDAFAGAADERPRLFSAQFLRPQVHTSTAGASELILAGRLGRGPVGWPCRLVVAGNERDDPLTLTIELLGTVPGWRLRTRMLGLRPERIAHQCTAVREVVANDRGGFVADTLVRSATTLLVDGQPVAVPEAAGQAPIQHVFLLGGTTAPGA